MYGCESWTMKKDECQRIDDFKLWCWRRLLRVPWTARRSNQSILKISPGCSWKDSCWSFNSNTSATWCKELTHWKRPWCWERLKAGGEGDRGWDGWMASPTQWTWVWVDSGSWWWTGRPGVLLFTGLQRVGHNWANELNWISLLVMGQEQFEDQHWLLEAPWRSWLNRSSFKFSKIYKHYRHQNISGLAIIPWFLWNFIYLFSLFLLWPQFWGENSDCDPYLGSYIDDKGQAPLLMAPHWVAEQKGTQFSWLSGHQFSPQAWVFPLFCHQTVHVAIIIDL